MRSIRASGPSIDEDRLRKERSSVNIEVKYYMPGQDVLERTDALLEKNYIVKYSHIMRYKYAKKRAGRKVLDIGCGYGYGSKMLHDSGREVIAMDISEEALKYARQHYPGPNYLIGSAEKLSFADSSFDSVVAFEVLEHVVKPELLLSEAHRVLKKGGTLYISTPNPRHIGNIIMHYLFGKAWSEKIDMNNAYHIKEFYYREFIEMLKKDNRFTIKDKFGQILLGGSLINKIIEKSHFKKALSYIAVMSGYFVPRIAGYVVVEAKKI